MVEFHRFKLTDAETAETKTVTIAVPRPDQFYDLYEVEYSTEAALEAFIDRVTAK
jgi:hypothetical protein